MNIKEVCLLSVFFSMVTAIFLLDTVYNAPVGCINLLISAVFFELLPAKTWLLSRVIIEALAIPSYIQVYLLASDASDIKALPINYGFITCVFLICLKYFIIFQLHLTLKHQNFFKRIMI